MKKIYTEEKYRKYNLTKSRKGLKKRKKAYQPNYTSYKDSISNIKDKVEAPEDFRLIENTEKCLKFFRDIRSKEFLTNIKGEKSVEFTLEKVTEIDYGTISILTAISDDLKYKNINFRGNLPPNEKSREFVIESGFLNHMFDSRGNKISVKSKSDLIFFEKGSGKLLEKDNKKISEMVKSAILHLTGESKHCLPMKTLILEICGNSIEWGNTSKKQWLFGLKYNENKVIFTVTDVGLGILKTLRKKNFQKINDAFTFISPMEILIGAFQKKYNSSTMEENRNKGLPSVRLNYEIGNIKNLIVITNDVILHYDNQLKSKTFIKGTPRYKGTFYQWEMDLDCVNKIYKT